MKVRTPDDICVDYLELYRDDQYQQLSELLKKEPPSIIATFCYYVVKYEGIHHLDFIRKLIQ